MIIDGEKWACEACVRGHRVSNCQHSDRPLQHINKKGRPVSQCQHCRAMRKSRSSHIKCDCGEKTHKCAHLQQTVEGHRDSCCCNHGGRCTCSHKKELTLDTVPESGSEGECHSTKAKPVARRKRTNTSHSEPVLSFDENGHHKPIHKHAKASQKAAPYPLNRGSSMHSLSSAGSRSHDNLHLKTRNGRTRTNTSSTNPSDHESDDASPGSPLQSLNGQLPPLDLSSIRYPEYQSSFDMFGGGLSDHEPPVFSAGLSATPVDWTQYDGLQTKADSTFGPSSFDPSQSYLGFELGSTEPTLASNSGDVSETDDFLPSFGQRPSALGSFSNSAASSFFNLAAQGGNNPTALTNDELGNLDYAQFKGTAASSKLMASPTSFDDAGAQFAMVEDDGIFFNSFTDCLTQTPDPVASGLWDNE